MQKYSRSNDEDSEKERGGCDTILSGSPWLLHPAPTQPRSPTLKEQKIQDCYPTLIQQSPGQGKWEAGSREKAEVVWGLKRLRQLLPTVKGKQEAETEGWSAELSSELP